MAGRIPKRDEVIKRPTSRSNKLMSEIEAEARKYGLDGSTYIAYRDAGILDDYIRRRFHEESARNATPTIIEKSWIGNQHGDAGRVRRIK